MASLLKVGDNLTVCSVDPPDGSCIVVDDDGTKWELCVDECENVRVQALRDALENLLNACEHWEDQNDPVLRTAREEIEAFDTRFDPKP